LRDQVTLTVFLDKHQNDPPHFVENYGRQVISKACGNEASSFLAVLDFVEQSDWDSEDIVVFLEDDYAVSPDWTEFVREGLQLADYVSLYDHPDKYSNMYSGIPCYLYKKPLRHWRTAPSTTNSYAMKKSTLMRDMAIHRHFSKDVSVSRDHEKFLELWNLGKKLVTCVPAAWSHEEIGMTCENVIKE
jgi:hypothetical protein